MELSETMSPNKSSVLEIQFVSGICLRMKVLTSTVVFLYTALLTSDSSRLPAPFPLASDQGMLTAPLNNTVLLADLPRVMLTMQRFAVVFCGIP